MASVINDLVDLIEPVVKALKNHGSDGLGSYNSDRGVFEGMLIGEEGFNRGFLVIRR